METYQPTPADLASRAYPVVEGLSPSELRMGAEEWTGSIGTVTYSAMSPRDRHEGPNGETDREEPMFGPKGEAGGPLDSILRTHGYNATDVRITSDEVLASIKAGMDVSFTTALGFATLVRQSRLNV
jgi:hypothetical protein